MNKKKISNLKNLIAQRRSRFLQKDAKPVAKSAPSVGKAEQPSAEQPKVEEPKAPEVPTAPEEPKPEIPEVSAETPVNECVGVAEAPAESAEDGMPVDLCGKATAEPIAEAPVAETAEPVVEAPIAEEPTTGKKSRRRKKENV